MIHDCRAIAGCLSVQFGLKMNNVFDTQVNRWLWLFICIFPRLYSFNVFRVSRLRMSCASTQRQVGFFLTECPLCRKWSVSTWRCRPPSYDPSRDSLSPLRCNTRTCGHSSILNWSFLYLWHLCFLTGGKGDVVHTSLSCYPDEGDGPGSGPFAAPQTGADGYTNGGLHDPGGFIH